MYLFVRKKMLTMDTPLYQSITAELSQEELLSIHNLISQYQPYKSADEILYILKQEHPLCLDSDLKDALIEFTQPHHHHQQQLPTPLKSAETEETFSRNWTDQETQILQDYVNRTRGRKNWIYCSRLIGTKTSVQCKAKYNNMKS